MITAAIDWLAAFSVPSSVFLAEHISYEFRLIRYRQETFFFLFLTARKICTTIFTKYQSNITNYYDTESVAMATLATFAFNIIAVYIFFVHHRVQIL